MKEEQCPDISHACHDPWATFGAEPPTENVRHIQQRVNAVYAKHAIHAKQVILAKRVILTKMRFSRNAQL